ncbi:hypothetical protein TREMEDRAFT_61592 [Tremella mesenterica DSM 1558]|uniref:uncharacterized protein n=1 Tax=Tremella mesenterica (strain ATCC 24925 / CBS 8224 / DSM 1558 / NBRC 9311 / NRRL Y-6157 / RJB 2259-6 / UBC 559-6) TaxID=578456 RepID=UPI0003F48F28|nr:uncharacterized protein TREMEDRAFT_61592 [Tremella mesenterica DSM 1558]EIW69822.1 hypothetical protein TREMEDRAFT_61592 [Tremella mesenterica DSM 1558]
MSDPREEAKKQAEAQARAKAKAEAAGKSPSSSSSDPKAAAAAQAAKEKAAKEQAAAKGGSSSSGSGSSSSRPSSSSSSSSSGGSSSSSSPSPKPSVATPQISANAWMSFFLFVCLCLIILQGPLGLTASAPAASLGGGWFGSSNSGGTGGWGGLPGCGMGVVMMPWCSNPVQPAIGGGGAGGGGGMGGQGGFALPGGGGGWSWYANPQQQGVQGFPGAQGMQGVPQIQNVQIQGGYDPYAGMICLYFPYLCPFVYLPMAQGQQIPNAYPYPPPPGDNSREYIRTSNGMIYEKPAKVVQVSQQLPRGRGGPYTYNQPQGPQIPYGYGIPQQNYGPPFPGGYNGIPRNQGLNMGIPPNYGTIPGQVGRIHSHPAPPPPLGAPPVSPATPINEQSPGLANLENAFYPLLVGAIALLVIFDYAT